MGIHSISTAARNAMLDAVVDLLDAGSAVTYPYIKFYDDPLLLAQCNFVNATTAFAAASGGSVAANSIADDTSVDDPGTGPYTVDRFRFFDQDNTEILRGTVTATGGGGDIEFNTVTWNTGDTVSVTSFSLVMPPGSA